MAVTSVDGGHCHPGAHDCLSPPQLAYGQDGQLKGFAVLEYETAEMAEEAQQRADGLALGGSHLRVAPTKFPGIPASLERNTEVFRHHFL